MKYNCIIGSFSSGIASEKRVLAILVLVRCDEPELQLLTIVAPARSRACVARGAGPFLLDSMVTVRCKLSLPSTLPSTLQTAPATSQGTSGTARSSTGTVAESLAPRQPSSLHEEFQQRSGVQAGDGQRQSNAGDTRDGTDGMLKFSRILKLMNFSEEKPHPSDANLGFSSIGSGPCRAHPLH